MGSIALFGLLMPVVSTQWSKALVVQATVTTGSFDLPPECSGMVFDDVIVGTDGNDEIEAGNGGYLILGLAGDDTIDGGNGPDCIVGGDGDDELNGGNGDDVIIGGPGNDEIDGGHGDDRLFGGEGNDEIEGGHGDDVVDGGPGHDQCEGGPGNNTYVSCDHDDHGSQSPSAPVPAATELPLPSPGRVSP